MGEHRHGPVVRDTGGFRVTCESCDKSFTGPTEAHAIAAYEEHAAPGMGEFARDIFSPGGQ